MTKSKPKPKILLVDDEAGLRDIYALRLTEYYDVVTARNGEEALEMTATEQPNLIVLDIMMPRISGFSVLEQLRSDIKTKNIPVMMMTALSQDAHKMQAQSLGAQHYLVKSQVTMDDFVNTIRDILPVD